MRKINLAIAGAVHTFTPFSGGNTVFHRQADVNSSAVWELVLHGHPIAIFNQASRTPTIPEYVSLAGYPTKTTCARLNSLDGVSVKVKNGTPYLNGREIDPNGWWSPCNLHENHL